MVLPASLGGDGTEQDDISRRIYFVLLYMPDTLSLSEGRVLSKAVPA
jgi:hypothetical protein